MKKVKRQPKGLHLVQAGVNLRVTPKMKKQFLDICKKDGKSKNWIISELLENYIKERNTLVSH